MIGASEFIVKLSNTKNVEELDSLFEEFNASMKNRSSFTQSEVDMIILECELFKYRKNLLLTEK